MREAGEDLRVGDLVYESKDGKIYKAPIGIVTESNRLFVKVSWLDFDDLLQTKSTLISKIIKWLRIKRG